MSSSSWMTSKRALCHKQAYTTPNDVTSYTYILRIHSFIIYSSSSWYGSRVVVLRDGLDETFNSFVLLDHIAIQKGYHVDLLHILLFHLLYDDDSHNHAQQSPSEGYQQQNQPKHVVTCSLTDGLYVILIHLVHDDWLHAVIEGL